MGVVDRKQELFTHVLRLRRAGRELPGNQDVAAVRVALERELGETVSKRLAGRVLGVSHTALERWIRTGDLPVVLSRAGRPEIPVPALLELWEAVEADRADGPRRYPLAPTMTRRRAAADRLRLPPDARGHAHLDLLQDRLREVGQVLDALARASYYVAICGTFPLVEGMLADAHGTWQQPHKCPLDARLDEAGALSAEEEAELLINRSSLDMLQFALREVWASRKPPAGAITAALNRHLALHGTARGWDTEANAVRAVLLLAATARVAEPLLAPRVAPSA